MSTMVRTDIHRPSAEGFDPEQYRLLGVYDLHPRYGSESRVETINEQIAAGHRFADHQKVSHCGHCGVRIRYAALLLHSSGEMIYVGETCLDGRFSGTRAEFRAMRDAAKAARDRETRLERFERNLIDAVSRDGRLEVLGHEPAVLNLPGNVSDFAFSVRGALFRSPLTDRQVSALAEAIDRAYGQAEREAEREAARAKERAASIPVPQGSQFVSGTIRSTKTVPNDHSYYGGDIPKMFVRDERGFTVYGTVPESLFRLHGGTLRELRGCEVSFRANLIRSSDDETFGFFKRPTQMVLLASEDEDAEDEG